MKSLSFPTDTLLSLYVIYKESNISYNYPKKSPLTLGENHPRLCYIRKQKEKHIN